MWYDGVRPVRAKALLYIQCQVSINLLPFQGALGWPCLPRVPAPLCAASALGYGLVGPSGRCKAAQNTKNVLTGQWDTARPRKKSPQTNLIFNLAFIYLILTGLHMTPPLSYDCHGE